jgi:hypothetical protein
MAAVTDDVFALEVSRMSKRLELVRSPTYWAVEAIRFAWYLIGSVLVVPWLLVWPAVVGWAAWLMAGGDAAAALRLLRADFPEVIAWFYVFGAAAQSLTVLGTRPYESELQRRLQAHEFSWRNDRERARRGIPPREGGP